MANSTTAAISTSATIERLENELADVRAELAMVRADRDRLERQVAALGGMQTDTIVLGEADKDDMLEDPPLPSIDDLMANLDSIIQAPDRPMTAAVDLVSHVDSATGIEEMISADLMLSDGYHDDDVPAAGTEPQPAQGPAKNTRLLVCMDVRPPIKYPLFKELITIGRSDSADVHVNCSHVSRIHARISITDEGAVIEDAGARNTIMVNSQPKDRHVLRHGDVLTIGKLQYTYIEIA